MELRFERAAGLDVHKRFVTACVRVPGQGADERVEHRYRCATTIRELNGLRRWLCDHHVRAVAMESTGVFWIPVWDALEQARFDQMLLVNPHYVRMIPREKTDANDAAWLCLLLEVGLLRSSFVPPRPIRDLRDLTRTRRREVQAATQVHQRIEKVLETAGVKMSSVLSNTMGVSGQSMIEALIDGERDPDVLAEMALGRLRAKIPELRDALDSRFRDHHALQLSELLARYKDHQARIERFDTLIEQRCVPYEAWINRTLTLPGVGLVSARSFLAEIGDDMAMWSTPQKFTKWCGVAPGNDQTGDRSRDCRTGKTNSFLADTIRQVAAAASRSGGTPFGQRKQALKQRGKPPAKALTAVAHSLMRTLWHMHTNGTDYQPAS